MRCTSKLWRTHMLQIATYLTSRDVPCFRFRAPDRALLESLLPDARVTCCETEAAFREALRTADVALTWSFEQEWFADAPRLRWIATPAAGRDYFRINPPQHVRLTYGEFHGPLMGETVVAMILSMTRGILDAAWTAGADPWPKALLAQRMRPLRGSHVAILGFGHIGEWAGRLLKPFGVRITGIRRRHVALPDWFGPEDRLITPDELDAILPDTDHLVLVLPSGTATDRILDARRIGLLPAHATVSNVGRGNAIDEDALAAALAGGHIAAACLDVFQREPLPEDSPLRTAPNLLVMPHASAFGDTYMPRFVEELAARCERIMGAD